MIKRADLDQMFRQPGLMVQNPQHVQQHYQHPQASQMHQSQQRLEQEKREKMRRQASMPTDKNIPDGVDEIAIGDGVARYRQLRDVERQLDATMMRKKLELAESIHHSKTRRYGTMRIWISNTAENQPWQSSDMDADAFEFDSGANSTYTVTIQGRLLDDGADDGLPESDSEDEADDADDQKEKAKPVEKVFSQYFTSIVCDFDRSKSLQPDNFTQIEWKRPENPTPKDSLFSELSFTRKADENIPMVVNLTRYHNPERFRLSEPLAQLLDTDEEDRAGVIMGIWEYARARHLQQDEDERKFNCDANLRVLFGQDTFYFPSIPQLIKPHMTSLPPVSLPYTVRVDKEYISPSADSGLEPSRPTVYDIQIPLSDPLTPLTKSILQPPASRFATLQSLQTLDEQLVLVIAAISQSKARHAFYSSMSNDPVSFIKRWLSSQKRDLEVLLGEAMRGGGEDASGEEWKKGGEGSVWDSETARESVGLWLARQGKGH
ncbi:hypothetical protein P154DRAFT_521378 [Amniculicola lignicola CBS 123094]|uniref:DM2 domain-containing protein n=1 Tax=Amniculicola lignicola CBS 123094 TaxID=1392246 RepID=A0A6A5WKD3_9PLEO|nr:hypothetical protein P154DRAFT_521378 [Amniculicola lignicola CBS 123094]